MDFKDHLRECVHSVEYRYDPSSFYTFHGILALIKKYLGDKEVIKYINCFRSVDLEGFFSPFEDKVYPLGYPIYDILDPISNGLKSKDPEFFNVTIGLLWTFYRELDRSLDRKIGGYSTDYYLASLLELFNEIYENKLEDYISNIKGAFEQIVNKNKEKVIYCYYELGGTEHWGKEIHFLDDSDLFKQEFYKRLKRYGLVDDIDLNEFSISKDLISKIFIANFQNKEIKDIFPRVKDFFKYESDFFYDFNLKLSDFLEYIIDIKEAKLIRQVPVDHLHISMENTIDDNKYGTSCYLIFNENKHVIHFQRNGERGFSPERLELFPEPILNLTHLLKLDLSRNKIRKIPSSIDRLTKLEYLFLDNNEFISLPENIGNLENLKILYVNENKISYLPASIGKLKSLEWLSLGDNNLNNLPKSMNKLTNLTHIYLAKNQFKKFPEVLFRMQSLVEIVLSDNFLSTIPESIANLKSLERLYLKNTKIKEIPESLKKCKTLHIII